VEYEGKTKDKLTIQNDSMEDSKFREFLKDSFEAARQNMKAGAAFYIWHADSEGYNFRGACRDVGWAVRECLIWKKNAMVLGRQDYQWQHEPCLYGWNEGGSHAWYSDRKQTTILEFDKPNRSAEHPTMKPIKLFDYLIQNSSKKGDVVLDTFGGSGTTIIACEQNGRCGYSTELDPKYCDVIIQRYINLKESSEDVFILDGVRKVPYAEVFNG
jgi:site-specific DNA-methyltransferase (adenine-specific)